MVENASKQAQGLRNDILKVGAEKIKQLENKSNKTKADLKVLKERKSMMKFFQKVDTKSVRMKTQKTNRKTCIDTHCNPGCKDTIFESKKLSAKLTKEYKKMPLYLDFLQKQNDKIFQNKKTVLKGDFYEKYTPKQIQEIQTEGAISGCSFEGARYFYKNA